MPWTIAAAAVVAAAGGASTPRRAAAASTPRTNCVNCGAPYGRFASACSYCRTLLPRDARDGLANNPEAFGRASEASTTLGTAFIPYHGDMPQMLSGGVMLVSGADAPAFESGGGGDFAGSGADGSWGEP